MKRISKCRRDILPHQRPYIVQAAFRYVKGKAIVTSNGPIYASILRYLPEKQCKKIKKTTVSKQEEGKSIRNKNFAKNANSIHLRRKTRFLSRNNSPMVVITYT